MWWFIDKDHIYQGLTFINEPQSLSFLNHHLPINFTWQPVGVRLQTAHYEYEEPKVPGSDFPGIAGDLAITQKAADILRPLLNEQAQLLPLEGEDQTYYLVYVKFRDCLDKEKSVIERFRSTGNIKRVTAYVFQEGCLDGVHIFRLPHLAGYVIVSDTFKIVVEQHNLKGLKFRQLRLA